TARAGLRGDRVAARRTGRARGLRRRYPPVPGALPRPQLRQPSGTAGDGRGRDPRRRDRRRRLAGPGDGWGGPLMPFSTETQARAKEIVGRYPVGKERSALLPLLHL